MRALNEYVYKLGTVANEHVGMVGLNDTYRGLGFGKENHSPDPTPPHQAFFLPGVNKKVI